MPEFFELISIFFKILFIVFFFGFCIFIHEFGHLIVAMWRGLHIEKFSVGFGKPIYKWRRNNIDYLISWLPFGGYVALPQLDPSENPKTGDGNPLPLAKPLDRTLTAFAGPLFNILFGFFLACIIWQVGIEGPAPSESFAIGYLPETYIDANGKERPNPEFQAGLKLGDLVVGVNGKAFDKGWQEAVEMIVYSPQGQVELNILREDKPMKISYGLVPNPNYEGLGYPFMVPLLSTRVGDVMPNTPAARAGLKKGDILLEVQGEKVINAEILVERIQEAGDKPISLKVRRESEEILLKNIIAEQKEVNGVVRNLIGIQIESVEAARITHFPTPFRQFSDVIVRTFNTFRGLFDHKNPIQAKHMSGPIGIFHMLFLIVSNAGFMAALNLIILISFSLAIINLFPLPILDGGHITMGLIEIIFGKRLPTKILLFLTYTFAVLLISFMLYVTYYDARRVGRSFYPPSPQHTIEQDKEAGASEKDDTKQNPNPPSD